MLRRRTSLAGLLAVLALIVAACGGGDAEPAEPAASGAGGDLSALIASYEVVAGRPQRLLVGLQANDARLVAFGELPVAFRYRGTQDEPVAKPEVAFTGTARFLPVPGQEVDPSSRGPRLVKPSEAIGVYAVRDVTFPDAGFWEVAAVVELPEGRETVSAAFQVRPEAIIPAPGDPAPRTQNPVFGADGVAPSSIDSRAQAGEPDPAPALHGTSVAAALDAGKPVVVVVSTPVYCRSQFCGPITDMVAGVAADYGDRAAFVHLEVWEDFQKQKVSPYASEWIFRKGADVNEPWVWLVGADGVIVDRWDNVATEDELRNALDALPAA